MHNIKSGCIMLCFSAVVCFCSASLLVSNDGGLSWQKLHQQEGNKSSYRRFLKFKILPFDNKSHERTKTNNAVICLKDN